MHRWLIVLCLVFLSVPGRSQYPGYVLLNQTEAFKKTFTQTASATESMEADFRQEKTLTMLSEKILSTGKFWYRRKNKLRMEYIQPYPYLMILNDGKIFTREGKQENKLSAGSSKIFQQINRILVDGVAGNVLDNPDFNSRVFESKESYLLELKPISKNLSVLYKNLLIIIDKKDFTASSIEMLEVSGDKTVVRFQNKIINATIPETLFNIP